MERRAQSPASGVKSIIVTPKKESALKKAPCEVIAVGEIDPLPRWQPSAEPAA